jgi:hypothetical protein
MMSKLWAVLFILASNFSLSFGSSIQAQPGGAKTGEGSVSGIVILKGNPAIGVTVLLYPWSQGAQFDQANSLRDKTDESGQFQFTGVRAGKYWISALAPGYITPGDGDVMKQGLVVNLAEDEKIGDMRLEIKPGAVITGRIANAQGGPVVEERITLRKMDKSGKSQLYWINDQFNEMYMTDDRGQYRIFGLPEGRYLLSVGRDQKPGSAALTLSALFYPLTYYPNMPSEAEAKVIEVTEGAVASDIDITVPDPKKVFGVYGRVVDADTGQPIPGVGFRLGGISQGGKLTGGWALTGGISKSNGEFRLGVMTPGRYALLIDSEAGYIAEPVIFDLNEDDVTGVKVIARRAGSISGVVVIEGATDPKILSQLSKLSLSSFYKSIKSTIPGMPIFSSIENAKVGADGSFRIDRLEPGMVAIELARSPETRNLTIARIERNGAVTGEGVTIRAGEQVTGVRVVLAYSALAIRGELKVVGGALPASLRFQVTARRVDQSAQSMLSAEVDARSQFHLEGAPPGEYEIGLFPATGLYGERLDAQIASLISSVKERVVVGAGSQPSVVLVLDLSRKEGK